MNPRDAVVTGEARLHRMIRRGAPEERDPLVGGNADGQFTVPREPIRRRFKGLPPFVVNRGGEYCFMPGLSALRWIADLDT
ncbi:hypothetical protein ACWCPJ_31825 [Streptomyces collinus]